MSDRNFKKIAKVSVWRDTIPSSALSFTSQQLVPGEQIDVTSLRIRFKVERGLTRTPNQCDVEIMNLNSDSRHNFETKPLTVQLQAGYDDTPRLLFIGDLLFGMSEIKGATWQTLLQVGDSQRSYAYARVNRSYSSGTTYRQVITDVAKSLGATLPTSLASNPDLNRQFAQGVSMHGPARDEMSRLLAPFGLHWSIQNGSIQVLSDSQLASTVALPVDEGHGMLGTPQYGTPPRSGKPPHMTVQNLLYPELEPGGLIQLTSKDRNGKFRVEKVRHVGDTSGTAPFRTEIEIKEA